MELRLIDFHLATAAVVDRQGTPRGTAWLAARSSFVTCDHVVENCGGEIGHLRLTHGNAKVEVDTIERKPELDLAVVRTAEPIDVDPLPIIDRPPIGTRVTSYGYEHDYQSEFPQGHPMSEIGELTGEAVHKDYSVKLLAIAGPDVQEGLSGAPLWSLATDGSGVLGTITRSNKADQVWAVDAADLVAEWPEFVMLAAPALGRRSRRVAPDEPVWPVGLPDRKAESIRGSGQRLVGRKSLLEKMHDELARGAQEVDIFALHGMGGIGKTALAVEYCHQHADEYSLIWWISAQTAASTLGSYRMLADTLGLDYESDQDVQSVVELHLRKRNDWLAVFDNVEDQELFRKLKPRAGGGRLIVTSRIPDRWSNPLRVDLIDTDEAVEWLLASTAARHGHEGLPEHRAHAVALAERLDGLALALAMATAYIEETAETPGGYLQAYDENDEGLLGASDYLGDDYNRTVYTTWTVSIERLRANVPLASELLDYMSFYAPKRIPLRIFFEGLDRSRQELNEAVRALRQYSLIEVEGRYASVHRLVQGVTRASLPSQPA